MKKLIFSALFLVCFGLGFACQAYAEQKIVIIDIQKVLENSVQVQALNKEQETKIQALEEWIEVVKKDIEKQQTKEGKEKLFKQYREKYNQKKAEIIKDGQTKMQAAMNDISDVIQTQAKENGYDMIITKSVVVYGGEDITEDIQKAVNAKAQKNKTQKTVIKKSKK